MTTTKPLPADVATIRAAILDVIDAGQDAKGCTCQAQRHEWTFRFREDEQETERRVMFTDAVIARIAQLQQPPFVEQAQKEK